MVDVIVAKELRENENIIIRKADKTAVYVLMPRDEYLQKMETILNDPSKFCRIPKDTTATLKAQVNRILDAVNAKSGGLHFQKITGEFSPGYAYGNVKTHKAGNPLRPIISQISTPTYKLAKKLNQLLTPFVPSEFSLRSPTQFIDILENKSSNCLIASLDMESLFTNVPVDETIELIMQKVYHTEKTPLDIPENFSICRK